MNIFDKKVKIKEEQVDPSNGDLFKILIYQNEFIKAASPEDIIKFSEVGIGFIQIPWDKNLEYEQNTRQIISDFIANNPLQLPSNKIYMFYTTELYETERTDNVLVVGTKNLYTSHRFFHDKNLSYQNFDLEKIIYQYKVNSFKNPFNVFEVEHYTPDFSVDIIINNSYNFELIEGAANFIKETINDNGTVTEKLWLYNSQPQEIGVGQNAHDVELSDLLFVTESEIIEAPIDLDNPSLGTAAYKNEEDFATAAQGSKADTALQPNDNISELTNDAGYITNAEVDIPTLQEVLDSGSEANISKDFILNSTNFNIRQGGEMTIEGGGSLLIDSLGVVEVTEEGSLLIDSSGVVEVTEGGELKINSSGIVNVKSSGELKIDSGIVDVKGGEINLRSSSQIKLIDSSLIDLIEGSKIKLSQGFQLVGDTTNGLRYPYDLSQGFTDRSLVDKEYVDNNSGENNVQSDWDETDNNSDAYILNKPTIPTNNNQLTNGAGYITDYTVTESDVTQHESAITITESQISDLTVIENTSDLINDGADGTSTYIEEKDQYSQQIITSGGNYNNLLLEGRILIFDNSNAQAILTGINNTNYKRVTIINNSDYELQLNAEDTSSTETFRIKLPTGLANIGVEGTCDLVYVDELQRWQITDTFSSKYRPEHRGLTETSVEVVTSNAKSETVPIIELEVFRDAQSTPMTKADLNTEYPTALRGFMVVCKEIDIIYKKVDNNTNDWAEYKLTTVS